MIKTITRNYVEFPRSLLDIKDSPEVLYYKCKGDCGERGFDSTIFGNCLAVVGSRKATAYGRSVTESLVTELAFRGLTIVSGFMYGIDSIAHEAALDASGKTIAVLGHGIDYKVPSYQRMLFERLLKEEGLILSEYPDDFPSAAWTFPKRNRIVAGLSKAVLVVEAAEKSGSLITADFALKYGKKVFAVPGPINSAVSSGTNRLIKEGKADMVISAKDILEFFEIGSFDVESSEVGARQVKFELEVPEEYQIMNLLVVEPLNFNKIQLKTKIPVSELGMHLTNLVLRGFLKESGGKYRVS